MTLVIVAGAAVLVLSVGLVCGLVLIVKHQSRVCATLSLALDESSRSMQAIAGQALASMQHTESELLAGVLAHSGDERLAHHLLQRDSARDASRVAERLRQAQEADTLPPDTEPGVVLNTSYGAFGDPPGARVDEPQPQPAAQQ